MKTWHWLALILSQVLMWVAGYIAGYGKGRLAASKEVFALWKKSDEEFVSGLKSEMEKGQGDDNRGSS